ncbi:HrcA family transcriptional regulator [Mobiluncus mulieris]|uniref:HrcA family transcriptional regulator n=1 Tax=Mobiluncus mulieris TaxID=2052 RepID=UPI002430530F|nr:DeoR family transcriptional regulator [Mobiluncus mulieris]
MFDKTADRRLDVLRAIVSDYVETQEPVGSKSLVERYSLGVSAATIRNDMAALEEEGLIRQPHTSAGRVPTDKGYRFFVDQIDQIKPLSAPERQAITEFFSAAVGLDDVMERTVRLLAHLTRQTAVIEFPAFKQSTLRHLELVGMGAEPIRRVLAVVIASSGRVDQVLVNLPCGTTQSELNSLARSLENVFATTETPGGTQSEFTPVTGRAPPETAETPSHPAPQHEPATPRNPQQQASTQWCDPLSAPETRENARVLGEAIAATLASGQAESRIVMAGMANLARSGDFQETLTPLVEALEEQVVLLKLFSQMHEPEPVSVIIGQESGHEVLRDTAIVSSSYDTSGATRAHVGVIGPTRMDYPGSMRAVRAVARYLSGFLRQ